jgi:hypothetical protein
LEPHENGKVNWATISGEKNAIPFVRGKRSLENYLLIRSCKEGACKSPFYVSQPRKIVNTSSSNARIQRGSGKSFFEKKPKPTLLEEAKA